MIIDFRILDGVASIEGKKYAQMLHRIKKRIDTRGGAKILWKNINQTWKQRQIKKFHFYL